MYYLILAIIILNLIGFLYMGWDKRQAKKGNWRIPERRFFLFAFFGASFGIYLGMQVFRHKTQHTSFRIVIPMFMGLNVFAVYFFLKMGWG